HCTGRVEVKHQGQWGTVCDISWDLEDAAVVCRQLGCGSALEVPTDAYFGPGSGPIWMSHVGCNGSESALSDCTHRGPGQHNCYHDWDAGVICSGTWGGTSPSSSSCSFGAGNSPQTLPHGSVSKGAAELRLADGDSDCAGRVEVKLQGQWGTVCPYSWDLKDAAVVCRQLGCG
ncbi:DMBT1 protein, partial [Psilopogon haemacephalus]|nr:DMBT1 protein [Psilopogon haemacephalus]